VKRDDANFKRGYRGFVKLARAALARGDCAGAISNFAHAEYRRGALEGDRAMAQAWKLTTGVSLDLQKSIAAKCFKPAMRKGRR
jgi:hypothetical protein